MDSPMGRRQIISTKATPPGFAYPFPAFAVDGEWLEITRTVQGSVNHSLKKKTEAKEHAEKMKRRTQGTFTFDPQDLQDRVVVRSSKGPKPDPLLDLLAIYCVVISNPSNSNTMRRPAPTVRFRDLSDIATPIPKTPVTPVGKDKALGGGKVDGGGEESLMRDDLPDLWESNAGLDEEIEVPPHGARDGLPIAESDRVNLHEPCLHDLLSDDPIPGVLERGRTHVESGTTEPAPESKQPVGPLRAGPFMF
ncbi:hypothetical protein FRC06_009370 [Ceratobasidium sp. 370]|nr:hypothetical protein FRC06_009370 [Ceratobasidium sp. 370]